MRRSTRQLKHSISMIISIVCRANSPGGQRQRVAMGRTIVREPDLFLFDEPLSNLDAKLRVQMRTELKALHQQLKTTMVYVTHDQIEAMTMADRIVVMNGGRIEQSGSPLELYDRPVNKFVAGFLGITSHELHTGNTGARRRCATNAHAGGLLPFLSETRPQRRARKSKSAFARSTYRLADANEGFPYRVAVVEPTGSETHLFGTVAGVAVRAVFRDRIAPEPGSQMMLTIDPAKVHVFDRTTGVRI